MKKGLFTAIIMSLFMLCVMKIDANAANIIETKTEGNITWTMYDDGELKICKAATPNTKNHTYDKYMPKIETITIEDGVTEIWSSAFDDYNNLKKITIPNTVTYIDDCTFINCEGISEIILPNSVSGLGSFVFEDCTGLKKVTLSNSLSAIPWYTFKNCSSLKNIVIPNSVTQIGEYAFNDCVSLESVTLPDSIEKIDYEAFMNCNKLTNITIPDSVTEIGDRAFCSCVQLESVSMSNRLLDIVDLDSAFEGTRWLLNFKGSVSGAAGNYFYTLDKNGVLTFKGSGELGTFGADFYTGFNFAVTTIIIPKEVTQIVFTDNYYTFDGYFQNLNKVINYSSAELRFNPSDQYSWCNLGNTTEPIFLLSNGTAIKVNQKLLKHYTIKFDGNDATSGTMSDIIAEVDKDIMLPKNTFTKRGYIFGSWTYNVDYKHSNQCCDNGYIGLSLDDLIYYNIDTLILTAQWEKDPNYGLKKAGTVITDKKSKAKYKVVSSKKKTVKYYRTTNKSATKNSIPATITFEGITYKVTEIDAKALKGNKKAKTVTMNKNITKIGDEAFSGCTALSNLTIGANVTTIGNKAFYNTAIKNLTLPAKTVKLGKQFVYKCSKMKMLTVKSSKMTKNTIADGAYKGIGKSVVVKVPKAKVSAYTKLFQSKGLGKKVKIKAIK